MTGAELVATIGIVATLWAFGHFYWLRLIGCAALLLAWGTFTIAMPIWLILEKQSILYALAVLVISAMPALLWLAAALAALNWFYGERSRHGFRIPWNSTD